MLRPRTSLVATAAVIAALAVPGAASAADYPGWAPDVPWGAGCEPAQSVATRTAANCGATLVEGEAVPPPNAPPVVKRVIAAANEIERVHHEYLSPIPLGDLVHQRMRAALDQKRVLLPADLLQAVEEVADEFDLEILDALEGHVLRRGPLMAGSGRPERHQRDPSPLFCRLPHSVDQD